MSDENRSFDGTNNNLENPDWGAVDTHLLRYGKPSYYGGKSEMTNDCRPNPRDISNAVCKVENPIPNRQGLSDFVWAWGQFLDHEITISEAAEPHEERPMETPGDDDFPFFTINFNRTIYDPTTGTSVNNPRQQINEISAYIDATNVYGSNATRAAALRLFDGTGKLKTSDGNLLPFNHAGLPNAQTPDRPASAFFIAGDVRSNEVVPLICMHTLFVREHNRLCDEIIATSPDMAGNDEAIYQKARRTVSGLMQVITYEEFLPAILGETAISEYTGYNPSVNAGINNLFSTACFRLGHSMLSSAIKPDGLAELELRDMFFTPSTIVDNGIDPYLGGLARQVMQEIDTQIVEDVRSFLFGPPENQHLLDLASLNIQRGRDHGLPDYNQCRRNLGLKAAKDFDDVTSDKKLAKALKKVYEDVENIDPWIGGLAEDYHSEANVGELIFIVLKDQFERLRDGDRFWYEHDPALSAEEVAAIKETRLSDVLKRNTTIQNLQDNVFKAADADGRGRRRDRDEEETADD